MAKVIFQPWHSEYFMAKETDQLEAMKRKFAFLIGEAQRRTLQLPGGEADLRSDPDFTDEDRDFLMMINEGKEVPRIQEIRLDRSERNLLKELGKGRAQDERKQLRTKFEIDFLISEAGKLAPEIKAEGDRREPPYSPMRRRQIETMLERLESVKPEGEESDWLEFMRFAIFSPSEDYGVRVRDTNEEPLVWDVREDCIHKLTDSKSDPLAHLLSPCGGSFLDLEQNQNLRIMLAVYVACPTGDTPKACEDCLPNGIEDNSRIELAGPASAIVKEPLGEPSKP